jgi:hypothetical protein
MGMGMGQYGYGPCGAAMAGGLYTLNCESAVVATAVAGGGGGSNAGCGTAAAAVAVVVVGVGSVLDGASSGFGAVDARVGGDGVTAGLLLLLLLGVDIRHLCGTLHTRHA